MTIQYDSNFAYLISHRGIFELFGGAASLGNGASVSMTIYAGTQPTAATILSSWGSYNSSQPNTLLHLISARWQRANYTDNYISLGQFPAATNAINTGTASWAILWTSAVTASSIAAGSIPSTSFLVVPVSALAGSGILKFSNVNFIAGQPYAIAEGTMSISVP